jgi:ureidoglycolate dehydrogenase (NAD+)
MKHIPHAQLESWSAGLLRHVGFDSDSAVSAAEGLVQASLRGVDSHGIQLLPNYVECGKAGRLNLAPDFKFEKTGASMGVLDADHSLGFPAGNAAMDACEKMAEETGMGAVSVRNSSHGGMLAYYTVPKARKGYVAFATTNTTPRMIPPRAKQPFFGTNPFCYAFPLSGEEPLCYDAATTQITGNKVKLYRKLGLPLAEGLAADAEGEPTTDADRAELLYPFGGYKGLGIAMLVDILCGALAGMPNGDQVSQMYGNDQSEKRRLGQFYLMIRIDGFQPLKQFTENLQEEVNRMRAIPSLDGEPIILPGDPEKQAVAERGRDGIPLQESVLQALNTSAEHNHYPQLEL